MTGERRWRQVRRIVNAALALAVSAVMLGVLGSGHGSVPALGSALLPGHGAWTLAAVGSLPALQSQRPAGLEYPVQVSVTSHGIAIRASTDGDLFLALGYVQAALWLTEMDLDRRLGEGRLAQLAGPAGQATPAAPAGASSDQPGAGRGLLRTAAQQWADTPRSSPLAQALISYARGVNDYLSVARESHQWPGLFALAGSYPSNWTPVDSLVIQGELGRELDLVTAPPGASRPASLWRLPQRLPPAWYPVALAAPGLAFSGVSVPGLPGILLGRDAQLAWSRTDAAQPVNVQLSWDLRVPCPALIAFLTCPGQGAGSARFLAFAAEHYREPSGAEPHD